MVTEGAKDGGLVGIHAPARHVEMSHDAILSSWVMGVV